MPGPLVEGVDLYEKQALLSEYLLNTFLKDYSRREKYVLPLNRKMFFV